VTSTPKTSPTRKGQKRDSSKSPPPPKRKKPSPIRPLNAPPPDQSTQDMASIVRQQAGLMLHGRLPTKEEDQAFVRHVKRVKDDTRRYFSMITQRGNNEFNIGEAMMHLFEMDDWFHESSLRMSQRVLIEQQEIRAIMQTMDEKLDIIKVCV